MRFLCSLSVFVCVLAGISPFDFLLTRFFFSMLKKNDVMLYLLLKQKQIVGHMALQPCLLTVMQSRSNAI